MGIGGVAAGGTISFDVTPEIWSVLLPGFAKHTLTTVGGSNNTHDFGKAESREVESYTFVVGKGAYAMVFPGSKIAAFSISAAVGDSVKGTVSVVALEPFIYGLKDTGVDFGYLLDATAASDDIDGGILTFPGAQAQVNAGDTPAKIRSFTLNFDNGTRARKHLDKRRGPSSIFAGRCMVSVSMELYFDNYTLYKRFLGQSQIGYPVIPGKRILFDEVTLEINAGEGVDGKYTFTLPKTGYSVISAPVGDMDSEITMTVEGFGALDTSQGTSFTIEAVNDLAEAAYTTPSTDPITVVPLEANL
jgi:hypothetical protein